MNTEMIQHKIYKYNQKLKYANELDKEHIYHKKLRYYNKFKQYGGVKIPTFKKIDPRLNQCFNELEKHEKKIKSMEKTMNDILTTAEKFKAELNSCKTKVAGLQRAQPTPKTTDDRTFNQVVRDFEKRLTTRDQKFKFKLRQSEYSTALDLIETYRTDRKTKDSLRKTLNTKYIEPMKDKTKSPDAIIEEIKKNIAKFKTL